MDSFDYTSAEFQGWDTNDASGNSVGAPILPIDTDLTEHGIVYWDTAGSQHVYKDANDTWYEGDWATSDWKVCAGSSAKTTTLGTTSDNDNAWSSFPRSSANALGTGALVSAIPFPTKTSAAFHGRRHARIDSVQQPLSHAWSVPSYDTTPQASGSPNPLAQPSIGRSQWHQSTNAGRAYVSSGTEPPVLLQGRERRPDLFHMVPPRLSQQVVNLGTSTATWKLDTIGVMLSGGKYLNAGANATFKKFPGKTLREVIVDEMLARGDGQPLDILPLGYLQDYVGLLVNRCTGDATRVTLRTLLSCADAVDHIQNQPLETHIRQTYAAMAAAANPLTESLDASQHAVLRTCIRILLNTLCHTGKYKNNRFVVWERFNDDGSNTGYQGVVLDPVWRKYMVDAPDSTCFAMFSGYCAARQRAASSHVPRTRDLEMRCECAPTMTLSTTILIRVYDACCPLARSDSDIESQKVTFWCSYTVHPTPSLTCHDSPSPKATTHSSTEPSSRFSRRNSTIATWYSTLAVLTAHLRLP
jgi:hypothetical protein